LDPWSHHPETLGLTLTVTLILTLTLHVKFNPNRKLG